MISADHPRFSCTSDMSLTIYGKILSGPLVHTNDLSGTGVYHKMLFCKRSLSDSLKFSSDLIKLTKYIQFNIYFGI